LAINFGGLIALAFLAKFDLDKANELDRSVEEKMERKKSQRQVKEAMRERERVLGTLKLDVQVSADGSNVRTASVKELQAGARQHVILVMGPKKACRDALVGANLLKMDFAMKNVLVVPYETDVDSAVAATKPTGSGFGGAVAMARPVYETQPYVARPSQDDADAWAEYVRAEMNDAVRQSGDMAKEEGIAVVVANNGKVLRRGVGKVPWRQMVEELDEFIKKT